MENIRITTEPVLLIDSHHGIYSWKFLAESIIDGTIKCKNKKDKAVLDALAELGNVDNENYWDASQELQDSAILLDSKGNEFTIYQHEDIWAIPVEITTDKFEEYFGQ